MDKILDDRTGSTSDLCANLPVVLSLEQIASKIRSEGFRCEPDSIVNYVLKRVSYQRIKTYLYSVKAFGSFEIYDLKQAHDLMTFDRRLSAIALKYIGIFETQVKSRYAQLMGESYGAFALYDKSLFLRESLYDNTWQNIESEISRQVKHGNKRISNLQNQYNGKLPIWQIADYASFGSLSKLFSNTADVQITNSIAGFFNTNKDKLSSWLKTINDSRNICAHFNPFIVRKQIPSIPKSDKDISVPNTSPFYLFAMLEKLLRSSVSTHFNDPNLLYSQRISTELTAQIKPYLSTYPEMSDWIIKSYKKDWMDKKDQ